MRIYAYRMFMSGKSEAGTGFQPIIVQLTDIQ
jgi:hypothetical protein